MQMSMRNGVTPKLTLTLTLTDTGGAVLTLMLGYRSLYITWQQHMSLPGPSDPGPSLPGPSDPGPSLPGPTEPNCLTG